jgi:hypothetical protein
MAESYEYYVVWNRKHVIVVGRVGDKGHTEAIGPPKLEWMPATLDFLTDGDQVTRAEADEILAGWGVAFPSPAA